MTSVMAARGVQQIFSPKNIHKTKKTLKLSKTTVSRLRPKAPGKLRSIYSNKTMEPQVRTEGLCAF